MATLTSDFDSPAPLEEASDGQLSTHPPSELVAVAEAVKSGQEQRVPVRVLLAWFGAQRRGSFIVWLIRRRLEMLGVKTSPDFNSVWIDAEVEFVADDAKTAPNIEGALLATDAVPSSVSEKPEALPLEPLVGGAVEDPTYRIGRVAAANKLVLSVNPNATANHAITQMLAHGFSQLPVMQGDREVKGVVTWESVGARLALQDQDHTLTTFMVPAQIINADQSLFEAIEVISHHQYVLVQGSDRRITGIVTAYDLSKQFQQLTEPFLLLGEVEQHIRKLIVNKFRVDELKTICDPEDADRHVSSVADLTMGEYIRLLENPTHWEKVNLRIDRRLFIDQLQSVRRIRNDIMHFDPDPLGPDDLSRLRQFVSFMRNLRVIGAF